MTTDASAFYAKYGHPAVIFPNPDVNGGNGSGKNHLGGMDVIEQHTADFLQRMKKLYPVPSLVGPDQQHLWNYAKELGKHELVEGWCAALEREQKEPNPS